MNAAGIAASIALAVVLWAVFRNRPSFWLLIVVGNGAWAIGEFQAANYGWAAFWTFFALTALMNAIAADHRGRERDRKDVL